MQFMLREGQHIQYEHIGESDVYLDVHLFKNILNNLFSNAIKFSPEATDVFVKTLVQDDVFELCVRDQGMGIHPDDQIHLMDRFFRGSNAAHIQGTGLGLHIVSKYVEQLHGTICFNSQPGVGTEFLIHFNTTKNHRYEENSVD
jgi:signal transduction histidine kinase